MIERTIQPVIKVLLTRFFAVELLEVLLGKKLHLAYKAYAMMLECKESASLG
jgi:hypothetical protein